jgi:hypothetical protein
MKIAHDLGHPKELKAFEIEELSFVTSNPS